MMFRIQFTFVFLLLNIIIEQNTIRAAQSLDDFFPFGLEVGDTIMRKNDDESHGPIPLPQIFPYFDNNHRQIYQANNGLFSFLSGISTYNPIEFPIGSNQRLITPFWSDIDTRGFTGNSSDNSVYHQVYIQAAGNLTNVTITVFNKATSFVRQYFPREPIFTPSMVITGTWYRVGYCCTYIDRLNTFQMVLVTDESRSFAFFLYNDLQWASQTSNGPYAQAGFNAGDGVTARMLQHSRTSNITLLVNGSNVNVPGIFVFRVDTTTIEAGGCNDQEPLRHSPVHGHQIGGTTVILQGPCFNPNGTEIFCRFGEHETVPGLILSEFRATCVSPLVPYPGSVNLSVSLDGGDTFILSGLFTYMQMTDDILASEQIILRHNGIATQAVSWNDTIELEWILSEATLTGLTINDTLIDVEYEVLQPDEENTRKRQRALSSDVDIKIEKIITFASGIRPQSGRQTIQINLAEIAQRQNRILPLVSVALGVLRVGTYVYRGVKIYLRIKSVIKIVQTASEIGCDAWSDSQPDPSTWNQDLPPCPNTYRQAQVARAQYEPDTMCREGWSVPTYVPAVGNCWFHQGRPEFNEDNAVACYRSTRFNAAGAGAQCCYNTAGQIITRGAGAGSDDRYHSGRTFWKHQFHDVTTFLACCKLQSDPERCDKYLRQRPSRPGSDTMGQFGGTWGDPHFLTLDGTSYTFNGYGEYTYLAIPEQQSITFDTSTPLQFESQIRTAPLGTGMYGVTVIKAFAARVSSLTISITVSRRDHLLVYLNGDELIFEPDSDNPTQLDTITLRFEDFSITKNLTNEQFTLSWNIGVNIQITSVFVNTTLTRVLNVAAAVNGALKGNWTLGLIGGYDGDPTNDLRNNMGTIVGTVDTLSPQQIHQLYGMSWAINPARSLFHYELGENATFYSNQNQNYQPYFSEPAAGPLELNARQVCGIPFNSTNSSTWSPIQRTCYYDISVTGDLEFGRVSRQAAEQQVEDRVAMRNPPKFSSTLSLTQLVRIGEQVSISFQATSEFSSDIAYKLLHGPTGASFDATTGQFQWKVPEGTSVASKIPVQVSAQDAVYKLTSTHEVLLEVQLKSNSARTSTIMTLSFLFAFAPSILF